MFTVDKIRNILNNATINNALINFGNSSILALGHHPLGNCWKIDIQNIYSSQQSVYSLDISNALLTTSGRLPQKAPHIISPITGCICNENATISVITNSAVDGEVLSTALFAAEKEEQQKLILQNFNIDKAYKVVYNNLLFQTEIIEA